MQNTWYGRRDSLVDSAPSLSGSDSQFGQKLYPLRHPHWFWFHFSEACHRFTLVGNVGASRKFPNDAPWELLNQRLSSPVSANFWNCMVKIQGKKLRHLFTPSCPWLLRVYFSDSAWLILNIFIASHLSMVDINPIKASSTSITGIPLSVFALSGDW